MREALSYISWVINIHLRNCMKFIKFSVSSLRLSFTIIGTKNWCMHRNMHHYCKDSHLIFIFILHSVTHKDFLFFYSWNLRRFAEKILTLHSSTTGLGSFQTPRQKLVAFINLPTSHQQNPGKRSDRVFSEVNSHWQCYELEFK